MPDIKNLAAPVLIVSPEIVAVPSVNLNVRPASVTSSVSSPVAVKSIAPSVASKVTVGEVSAPATVA